MSGPTEDRLRGPTEERDGDALDARTAWGLDLDLGRAPAAALSGLLGLVVVLVGTIAHRGAPPWGLVLAVLAVLSGAVLARILGEGLALGVYGGAVLVVTQLANSFRPGGDVLVAADPLGYSWLALPLLMCAVAAFLPHRWFAGPAGRG